MFSTAPPVRASIYRATASMPVHDDIVTNRTRVEDGNTCIGSTL